MTRQCVLFLLSTNFTRPNCSYFVLDAEPVKGQFFPWCAGTFPNRPKVNDQKTCFVAQNCVTPLGFLLSFFFWLGRTMFYSIVFIFFHVLTKKTTSLPRSNFMKDFCFYFFFLKQTFLWSSLKSQPFFRFQKTSFANVMCFCLMQTQIVSNVILNKQQQKEVTNYFWLPLFFCITYLALDMLWDFYY